MKTYFSTVWVVTDLETAEGRLLAYNAIRHLKRSHTMRVAIINNPKNVSFCAYHKFDITFKLCKCALINFFLFQMELVFFFFIKLRM